MLLCPLQLNNAVTGGHSTMQFHTVNELWSHPSYPVMGFAEEVYFIAPGAIQLCGRLSRIFGPLDLLAQGILILLIWCLIMPVQVMATTFIVVPVRMLLRIGNLGDDLVLLAIAAAPMAIFAFYFGPNELLKLIKAYLFLG